MFSKKHILVNQNPWIRMQVSGMSFFLFFCTTVREFPNNRESFPYQDRSSSENPVIKPLNLQSTAPSSTINPYENGSENK